MSEIFRNRNAYQDNQQERSAKTILVQNDVEGFDLAQARGEPGQASF
jgi:hypothetical protein